MNAQLNKRMKLKKGRGIALQHAFALFTSVLLALLAGLLYFSSPARAVSTLHILDNETGGDCTAFGAWDPGTMTCTMNTDLDSEGIDSIHIEGDGITLDGAGYRLSSDSTTGNGVSVSGFRDVTVRNLEVRQFSIGIYVRDSRHVTLTGNNLHNNSFGAFVSGSGSDGNILLRNSFAANGYGLTIVNGPQATEVTSNTISGNGYGIELSGSGTSGSVIKGNVISGNTTYGITLGSGSSNNSIYNNTFDGNATHAFVSGSSGNTFNQPSPVGGNWWSGWTTPDSNGDGFVDNPYVFSGGQDNLPFATANSWDDAPPVITNVQPSGIIRNGNPAFSADYSDPEASAGVDVASVGGTFTQDPWGGTPGLSCTASGSPSGTISCTMSNPYGLIMNGHYEFELHITDNMGNTGTATGSLDYLAFHVLDTPTGGDCGLIGTWDDASNTCTLTADLTTDWAEAIHVEGSGITLDGAGHTITGTGPLADGVPEYGVYIPGQTGVTVKNLTVRSFYVAIGLANTHGSTITGNDLGNNMEGINLSGSSDNTVSRNSADPVGHWGIYQDGGTRNSYFDNSVVATGSLGNGFRMMYANGNKFLGNTITGTAAGVELHDSNSNNFMDNTVQSCGTGFRVFTRCSSNTIEGNVVRNNGYAMGFHDSTGNFVYHNSFENNTNQVYGSMSNSFNGGEAIGGNYWSTYDSPAEGCVDVDKNGFCDTPYDLYTTSNDPITVVRDNEPWTVDQGWQPEYYWTWYDNLYARNWVLLANPASSPQDIWYDLTIAGLGRALPALSGYGQGQVPPGMALTPTYSGLMGGPVESNCRAWAAGLTSQRILWAGNSLEEVPGVEAKRLSSHYYWTWYDQLTPGFTNWVLVANPDSLDIYYEIRIAGQTQASGAIPGGESVTSTFPGVIGGPVEVEAWTDTTKTAPADVMASQRALTNYGSAFNEVPGIPEEELSASYLWTWYDEQTPGAIDWVLLANPKDYTIYYQIRIAGMEMPGGSGSLAPAGQPGSLVTPRFPGVIGGPVDVSFWKDAVDGSLITEGIASQRSLWGPSFEEVPGYPAGMKSETYHWTWYDEQTPGMMNWVLVANNNSFEIYYEISIGGQLRAQGTIPAWENAAPRFPGIMAGPVEVRAYTNSSKTTPVGVMSSQRVLFNGYFNEVIGTNMS